MTSFLTAARVLAGTVMAGIALTTLGACAQGHHPELAATEPPAAHATGLPSSIPTDPVSAPATTAPATQSAQATQSVPSGPPPQPSLSAAPAAPAGFTEACTPAALLAYVKTQQGPSTGFGEVKVYACAGGYGRLYAKANPATSGDQPDGDQFFLQYSDGHWTTLARGAAINCGDGMPALAQACAVLEFAATH
jgi:hypothetical protein